MSWDLLRARSFKRRNELDGDVGGDCVEMAGWRIWGDRRGCLLLFWKTSQFESDHVIRSLNQICGQMYTRSAQSSSPATPSPALQWPVAGALRCGHLVQRQLSSFYGTCLRPGNNNNVSRNSSEMSLIIRHHQFPMRCILVNRALSPLNPRSLVKSIY